MGLSATQMRFLMVTARKSNVEYQGQQINQARTALANQSSELYTELMTLKAPTAPSVYQYVITPANNPTIDWSEKTSWPLNKTDQKNFLIYYAANEPQFKDFNVPLYIQETKEETGTDGIPKSVPTGKFIKDYEKNEDGTYKLDESKNRIPIYATDAELKGNYAYVTTGVDGAGNEASYTAIHVNEDEIFTYDPITGTFVLDSAKTKEDGSAYEVTDMPAWAQAYNLARSQYTTYSEPKKYAIYTEEYQGSDAFKSDTDLTKEAKALAFTSSPTINYNQSQYNAALAQYQADLKEYNEACDEINAKTEEIHEADKKLELQLKQLDTEQEAIQTEYEALKKVLEKNIENTFKTFG